ncbi:MAG: PH domain-containing protein [Muribaculaceae bacterium]|nr:PH domain-containing protein [Muribaculaceae bacterium]
MMKSKVNFSTYTYILTSIISLALFAILIFSVRDEPTFFYVLAVYLVLIFLGLYFSPLYVIADPKTVRAKSILHSIKIPVKDIVSVELFQPTMGARRLFASGGYMGYWGYFREGDVGNYRGAFGKASDCFLIRLKNGDKYVLGCEDPKAMVDYIKAHMNATAGA